MQVYYMPNNITPGFFLYLFCSFLFTKLKEHFNLKQNFNNLESAFLLTERERVAAFISR